MKFQSYHVIVRDLGRCCTIIVVMTGPAGSCVMRRLQLTFFRILAILRVGLSMICVLLSMIFKLCYTHPCSVKRLISPDFGIKVVSKSESADAKYKPVGPVIIARVVIPGMHIQDVRLSRSRVIRFLDSGTQYQKPGMSKSERKEFRPEPRNISCLYHSGTKML